MEGSRDTSFQTKKVSKCKVDTRRNSHRELLLFFAEKEIKFLPPKNGSGEELMIEKRVVWKCGEE